MSPLNRALLAYDGSPKAREALFVATYLAGRWQISLPVAETILRVCEENQSNLLIMGGYGYNPVLEIVLGSAVDQVLREAHKPMLICR